MHTYRVVLRQTKDMMESTTPVGIRLMRLVESLYVDFRIYPFIHIQHYAYACLSEIDAYAE